MIYETENFLTEAKKLGFTETNLSSFMSLYLDDPVQTDKDFKNKFDRPLYMIADKKEGSITLKLIDNDFFLSEEYAEMKEHKFFTDLYGVYKRLCN